MENTYNNLSNLKPLDEYIRDIKSRNVQFAQVFPDLENTIKNVCSYDELYKKLIEESYYICNELIRGKGEKSSRTRNTMTEIEKEDLYTNMCNNINRALIFQSTENAANLNKESDLLSPIIKPVDVNKSYFCSTNRFTTTDIKNNKDREKMNTLKNINPSNNMINIQNQNTNLQNNINNNTNLFPTEDLLFLINNVKEIEKNLEYEDPVKKIEFFENKISKNLKKLEDLEHKEVKLVESKYEIELKENDLNILYKQFEDKFCKLEEYLEFIKNSENSNKNNIREKENILYYTTGIEPTNDKSKFSSNSRNNYYNDKVIEIVHNSSEDNLNNISQNGSIYSNSGYNTNKSTPKEYSRKINSLLSNHQIKEAGDIWKQFNYEKFENSSIERSFEMLNYIIRLKDKEIDLINRKLQIFEQKFIEMNRKDVEIVQLLAELENYKNKLKQFESQKRDIGMSESKLNNISRENTLLYKENLKLKSLMQQEKYLNMKNINL